MSSAPHAPATRSRSATEVPAYAGPGVPTTLAHTARAEWARLWSVRSSWAFAGVTALAVLGIGTLVGLDAAGDPTVAQEPGASAWDGSRPTSMFALFGVLALAVVATTADHGTRGIVPTLQWTPRRGVLLAARTGVVIAVTTVLGVLLVCSATVVVWAQVPEVGILESEGAGAVGDLALVLACAAGLAAGLGLLLRSTAGGLVTVIALVLVLPPLLAQLPYDWAVTTSAHLPGSSALFLFFGEGPSDDMTAGVARLTLLVWAAVALTAGGWRLLRTDADH